MENIYISNLKIDHVRHLNNITIPLSREKIKHLIFTGKNGSGKTSVLEALSGHLNELVISDNQKLYEDNLQFFEKRLKELQACGEKNAELLEAEKNVEYYTKELERMKNGVSLEFNQPSNVLRYYFEKGELILAYYKADRIFKADAPKHVEKVELKDNYALSETPREVFAKYLLDLKVTEALARNNGKVEKANEIKSWFDKFQDLLRKVFDDPSLKLVFEEDTFSFYIQEKDKEPFSINEMSSGFAAVLDIVLDIIVRMEKKTKRTFNFTIPGIVLVDEIETHLHLELQKNVLGLLTTIFPNIQFIMSTHSPFILNSIEDAVIYDLEKKILVKNGLSDVPYGGIVEGYFNASELSATLEKKFERYKELVNKKDLTDDDFEEITELEMFLDEIPDYLALNLTTEYQRLKMELKNREDIRW